MAPDLVTLSIRPRLVWGPRDATVLPALLRMARAGSFAWIDGGQAHTSTTHVHNLVHAVTLALHRGKPGSAYFVTDDGQRPREFLSALAASQGVTLPTRSLPGWVARPLSSVVEERIACSTVWHAAADPLRHRHDVAHRHHTHRSSTRRSGICSRS